MNHLSSFRKAVGASLDAAQPLQPVFPPTYWPLHPNGITVALTCTISGGAQWRPHPSEVPLTLSTPHRACLWPPRPAVHPPYTL